MDAKGNPSSQPRIVRVLTDPSFRRRAIAYVLGRPVSLGTNDRTILEEVIFPYYVSQPDVQTILFIGVAWYTRHYENFFAGKNYWTLDISPLAKRFGARQHVVAAVEEMDSFFAEGYFDLIVLNGVFGHGLDEEGQCERAFDQCYRLLRKGGHLLLGWNDVPEHTPMALSSIQTLQHFQPTDLPRLGEHLYLTDTIYRHVYQLFRKPLS
jgi:SAM-dependent methyltransferase